MKQLIKNKKAEVGMSFETLLKNILWILFFVVLASGVYYLINFLKGIS